MTKQEKILKRGEIRYEIEKKLKVIEDKLIQRDYKMAQAWKEGFVDKIPTSIGEATIDKEGTVTVGDYVFKFDFGFTNALSESLLKDKV